jgi:PKD repeat protein
MRKALLTSLLLIVVSAVMNANPVTQQTAKQVAVNFCTQTWSKAPSTITLAFTEVGNDGNAVYYVFNTDNGFVIVSAEDAAHPVLGYSTEGPFVIPAENNNFAWWMNCCKQEIMLARTKKMTASADIAEEWNNYQNNTALKTRSMMVTVGPLVQSTWNQSPYYNNMCPGGSVTGCVATAMAQIMKYWSYPPAGHGTSSYWDETAYGMQQNYGKLSEQYDTVKYNWSNTAMPLSISSNNYNIAKLMYDCGVSVDMDYSPSESGAWVVTGDYPVCAQVAFVKYFGYNPATIQGLYQSAYNNTNWTNLIENELNNKRPVQYVGWDSISPNNAAGHTWVCDGYSSSTQFHMNWGWGGSNNGYFALNALNAGGYKFNWWNEALIGIEPPSASPYFVGSPTVGCTGLTVQFTDQSYTDSNLSITGRTWLLPGGNPSTSHSTNPSVVYNTPGNYDVTEIISTIRGNDTMVRKAYVSVASTSTLPLVQGFQSPTFPPTGWINNNPNLYSYQWQLCTLTGGFGASTQCMEFNNCQGYQDWAPPGKAGLDIIGQRQQMYTAEYNFTGITSPKLYFDVAYAPYSTTYSDTLAVYYSTDCGNTFTQVYAKGGLTLGTTGNYVTTGADTNSIGCFLPLSNNWRTDTIKIPAIANMNNVMFSFENRSGNGSPVYIDNINIPGIPTGVATIAATQSVKVYPNPNNGVFMMSLNTTGATPFVKIYNVLGQEVYTAQLKNQNTQVDLSSQAKGLYIYRVFSENGASILTGRVVVQ